MYFKLLHVNNSRNNTTVSWIVLNKCWAVGWRFQEIRFVAVSSELSLSIQILQKRNGCSQSLIVFPAPLNICICLMLSINACCSCKLQLKTTEPAPTLKCNRSRKVTFEIEKSNLRFKFWSKSHFGWSLIYCPLMFYNC